METIEYGSVEETRILDKNGSTATEEVSFRNGSPVLPIKRRYVIREKASSLEEVQAIHQSFYDQYSKDKKMLEPSFRFEDKGKDFYAIKSYTVLSYTSMYDIA